LADSFELKFVLSIGKLVNKHVPGKLTTPTSARYKIVKNAVQRETVLYIQDTQSHGSFIRVDHRQVMQRTWNLLYSAALANAYDPVATKPYENHPTLGPLTIIEAYLLWSRTRSRPPRRPLAARSIRQNLAREKKGILSQIQNLTAVNVATNCKVLAH